MNISKAINQLRFTQYAAYLKAQGLSDASIKRKLSSLSSFQKFLIKKKILVPNLRSDKLTSEIFTPPSEKLTSDKLRSKFSFPFSKYILGATLLIILAGLGYGLYSQAIYKARTNLAYSTAASTTTPNRILSFQGRLTDSSGNPISSSTAIVFRLFNAGTGGTELYVSDTGNSQTVVPDENGIFSVVIGKTHGAAIPSSVFSENAEVWLQITAGGETMDPRQQIATVGYALNSETLQGLPPSASGFKDTVLVIDGSGNLNLGETSPTIKSTSGTLGVEGQAVLIKATDGSGGNITINPDGEGKLKLITEGLGSTAVGGFIEATNANLASGNLYSGLIRNENRDYNFIDFSNFAIGTTAITSQFSVNASGNLTTAGTINTSIGITAPKITLSVGASNGFILQSDANGNATWVNASTAGIGSSYDVGSGLSRSGNIFKFGGALTENANLTIGNTSAFFVNSTNGNVGIGGTNPSGPLEVFTGNNISRIKVGSNGAITLAGDVSLANGTVSYLSLYGGGYLYGSANNFQIGTNQANSPIRFLQNDIEYMRLAVGGNVGIGTTSPTYKLELVGSNNIFRIGDTAGNDLVNITESNAQFNLPTTFTSAGDVSLANDLNFTNSTASYIRSQSPLYIQTEHPTNNINLVLSAANSGVVLIDDNAQITSNLAVGGTFTLSVGASSGYVLQSDASGNAAWVSAVGIGGTYTANNGITLTGSNFQLGGALTQNTRLNIGNTEVMYVDYTTGLIGMGTTAPGYKLDLTGALHTTGIAYLDGGIRITPGNQIVLDGSAASNANIKTTTSGSKDILFTTNNATQMYINSSGNVGIGTTNPLQKLQVGSYTDSSSNIIRIANSNVTNSPTLTSYFSNGAREWVTGLTGGVGDYVIGLNPAGYTKDNVYASAKLTINGTGNVGIGTTNPNVKLEISSANTGSGFLRLMNTSSAGGDINGIDFYHNTNTGLQAYIRDEILAGWGTKLNFGTANAYGTAATKMTLDNNGNLGIGTTAPGYKLHVSGDALISTRLGIGSTNSLYSLNVGGTSGLNDAFISGSVGIGTTAPSKKLDVAGDINLTGTIFSNGASGTSGQVLSSTGTGLQWVNASGLGQTYSVTNGLTMNSNVISLGGTLTSNTNLTIGNTSVLFLGTNGNVGIGTTNPVSQLDIVGNPTSFYTSAYQMSITNNATAYNANPQTGIVFLNKYSSTGAVYQMGSINVGKENTTDNNANGFISFSTKNSSNFAERIRIDSSGNVGIGTTNPTYKLHVMSSGTTSAGLLVAGGSTIYGPGAANAHSGEMILGDIGSQQGRLSYDYARANLYLNNAYDGASTANGNIFFQTKTSSTAVDALTIQGSGNVGIGTTNPTAALDIGGTAIAIGRQSSYAVNSGLILADSSGDRWQINKLGLTYDFGITSDSGANYPFYIKRTTQNLGIGTTNPSKKLDVAGDINLTGTIFSNGTSGTSGQILSSTGTGLQWVNASAVGGTYTAGIGLTLSSTNVFSLNLGNTNTWLAPQYFNNNVGLGTSSPTYKLELVGSGSLLRIGDTAGNDLINITDSSAQFNLPTTFTSTGDVNLANNLNFTNSTASYIKSAAPLYLQAGESFNSSDLTLKTYNYGNVIIDSQKLAIGGSLSYAQGAAAGYILQSDASGNASWVPAVGIGGTYTANNGITLTANNFQLGGPLTQNTRLNIGNTEVMYIDYATGRIGMGTTNPSNTLEVNGGITSRDDMKIYSSAQHLVMYESDNSNKSWVVGVNGGQLRFTESGIGYPLSLNPGGSVGIGGTAGNTNPYLYVSSAGNVGIGTTNPVGKLSIKGSGNDQYSYALHSDNSDGTNLFTVRNNGTVGIGTSVPYANLSVIGTGATGSILTIGDFISNSLDSTNNWNQGAAIRIGYGMTTENYDSKITSFYNANFSNGSRLQLQTHNGTSGLWNTGLLVDENGNVGIGTTTPTKKLDVAGDINLTGTIFSNGTSGTSGQVLSSTGTGLAWVNASSVGGTYVFANGLTNNAGTVGLGGTLTTDTQIATSSFGLSFLGLGGTQGLYQASSGNVGIGMTSPGAKLQIDEAGAPSAIRISFNAGAYGTNYRSDIYHAGNTQGVGGLGGLQFLAQSPTAGQNGQRIIFANQTSTNAAVVNMMIDASGNVGIGTTNPLSKLTVVNGVSGGAAPNGTYDTLSLENNNINYLNFITPQSNRNGILFSGATRGRGAIVYTNSDTTYGAGNTESMIFSVNGNIPPSLLIHSSGNVGIGTTNPLYALDIGGTNKIAIGSTVIANLAGGTGSMYFGNGGASASGADYNLSVGKDALYNLTNGDYNTALGNQAGYYTTGSSNAYLGYQAGIGNNGATGSENVAIGSQAGHELTTASQNVILGRSAGYMLTSGSRNTLIGYKAGYNLDTGATGNIFLGYQAGYNESGSNKLYIDNSNTGSPLIWGDFSTDILGFNGSVGIGTTNPSKKLDVAGDINLTGTIFSNGASGTSGQILSSTGTGLQWVNASSVGGTYTANNGITLTGGNFQLGGALTQNTRLNIGNTEVMYIDYTNGNIGFGTTNPGYKLEQKGSFHLVNKEGTSDLGEIISQSSGLTIKGSYGSHLELGTDVGVSGAGGGRFGFYTPYGEFYFGGIGVTSQLISGSDWIFRTGGYRQSSEGTERMRITNIGNVGIGTTNPNLATLEIAGTPQFGNPILRVHDKTSATADVGGYINLSGYITGTSTYGDFARIKGAKANGSAGDQSGYLSFETNRGAGTQEALRINSTGNIGIGTTAPSKKLDVAGDINLTGTIFSNGTSGTSGQILSSTGTGLQWVNATGLGQTYSVTNGLSMASNVISLGGTLTSNTNLTIGNTSVLFIDGTSGFVGVGTTNPKGIFHISQNNNNPPISSGGTYSVGSTTWASLSSNAVSRIGFIGVGNVSGSNIPLASNPLGSTYASAGIVGLSSSYSGSALAHGVVGIGMNNGSAAATGGIFGGKFKSLAGANYDTNNGDSFYGVYGEANNTLGVATTVTATKLYGLYGSAIGTTRSDIGYGGYFSATGSTTNFGIYSAAGTNYFNDNVGIGTTAPNKKLDVSGDINLTGTIFTAGTSGTSGQVLTSTGTGLQWVNASSVGGTYTFTNGLTNNAGTVGLGGTLTQDTNLTIGNTSVLFIKGTTGNIGLGTTNPLSPLSIYTANNVSTVNIENSYATTQPLITAKATSSSGYAAIQIDRPNANRSSTLKFSTAGTTDWAIGTFVPASGTNSIFSIGYTAGSAPGVSGSNFVIDTSGRVGIGTTSPTVKVDIRGDMIVANTDRSKLIYQNSALQRFAGFGSVGLLESQGGGLQLNTNGNYPIALGTYNTEAVRIDTSGNVGIGTTNPTQKLDVNGTSIFRDSLTIQKGNNVSLNIDGNVGGAYSSLKINSNTSAWYVGLQDNLFGGGLNFNISGPTSTPLMLLSRTGNVGIGTTNPSKKLDVAGDINLTGTIFSNGTSGTSGQILSSTGTGLQWVNASSVGGTYTFTNGLTNNAGTVGLGGTLTQGTQIGTSSFDLSFIGQGGTQAFLLSNSGYAAINTAVPSPYAGTDLYVKNQIALGESSNFQGIYGPNGIEYLRNAQNYITASNASGSLWFRTGGSNDRMVINSSGNVGIGTTNPAVRLEVAGGTADVQLKLSSSDAWSGIQFTDSGSSDYLFYNGSTSTFAIGGGGSVVAGKKLHIDGATSIGANYDAYSAPTNGLIVEGNVGIGTTNPSKKLDIAGDINLTGTIFTTGTSGTSGQVLSSTGTGLQWVNASGLGQTYSVTNGLNMSGNVISLGGSLTANTRLNIGNTEVMYIDYATGNVGIGTTNSTSKLNVSGDITVSNNLNLNGTNGILTYYSLTSKSSAGLTLENLYAYPVIIKTNGSEVARFSSSGNVGIGTTNPSKKLDVAGDINLTGTIFSNGTSGSSGQVLSSTGTGLQWVNATGLGQTYSVTNGLNMSGNVIGLGGSLTANTRLNIGNTEVMYIDYATGNIGINTTNPTSIKFSVNGSAQVQSLAVKSGASTISFNTSNISANASDEYSLRNIIGTGYLTFHTGGNGAAYERLRIDSSGNVGIGTTNPTQKLDINGSLNIGGSMAIGSTQLVTNLNSDMLDGLHAASFVQIGTTGSFIYTASNGLTQVGNDFRLGGALTANTRLNIGNTEVMYIDYATGNVGLGTTNPGGILEVTDGTNAQFQILANYSNPLYRKKGGNYLAYFTYGGVDDARLGLYSGGVIKNYLNSNGVSYFNGGNVGIGTTNPATPLEISSTTDSILRLRQNQAGNVWNYIEFYNSTARQWYTGADGSGNFLLGRDGATGYVGVPEANFYVGANVGIGTTNPSKKLDIAGDINLTGTIFSNGTSGTSGQILSSTGTGLQWVNASSVGGTYVFTNGLTNNAGTVGLGGSLTANTRLNIGNTEVMYIDYATGNIGVGTTNPLAKLSINGDLSVGTFATIANNLAIGDTVNTSYKLIVGGNGTAYNTYINGSIALNGGQINYVTQLHSSSNLDIKATGGILSLYTGATEKFRINSSGNVGIGTTNPLAKLHIGGTGITSGITFGDAGDVSLYRYSSSYLATNKGLYVSGGPLIIGATKNLYFDDGNDTYISETSANNLDFVNGAYINRFSSTGNLGLGTTSPTQKLDINGSLNIGGSMAIGSTQLVTNLNSDMLDGLHSSSFVQVGTTGSFLYTASNGITQVGNDFRLGGNLTATTQIGTSSFDLSFVGLGGTQSLFIGSSGFVGIGTTSQAYRFNVNGDIYMGNNGYLYFGQSNLSLDRSGSNTLRFSSNNRSRMTLSDTLIDINSSGTPVNFRVAGVSDPNTFFVNSATNSVGIGTSAPTYKLELVGSGSLLRIGDTAGNDLVNITDSSAQFNLPTTFTSTGDVNLANNLNFTNQTASYIRSNAPMYLEAGESFESNDLTLRTFNSGNVVIDSQKLAIGGTLTYAQGAQSGYLLQSDASGNASWVPATGIGGTYTFTNGLTNTAGTVGLGGTLTTDTNLTIGNTSVLYLSTNGNVGIGTTAPSAKLTIKSGDVFLDYDKVLGAGTSYGAVWNRINLYNGSTGDMEFTTYQASYYSRFYSNMSVQGNVGIGTTNPSKKLDVAGDINLTGTIFSNGTSGSSGQVLSSTGTGLQWVNAAGLGQTYSATNGLNMSGNVIGLGGSLTANTRLNIGNTEVMYLDYATGNIGIGHTAPIGKLDIYQTNGLTYGTIANFLNPNNGSQTSMILGAGASGTANSGQSTFYLADRGTSRWGLQLEYTTGDFKILDADASTAPFTIKNNTPANTLFLNSSGFVGIGTTSPSKKLDVAGDINLTGTIFSNGTSGSSGQVLSSTGTGLQWVNAAGLGQTYSATNGLNMSGNVIGLGGSLTDNTQIGTSSFNLTIGNNTTYPALYISSNGNIGLGTSNPGVKLDIYQGNVRLSSPYNIGTAVGSNTNSIKFYDDAVGSMDFTTYNTSPGFRFFNGTSIVFTIKGAAGNVGIGTTNPSQKLDINGSLNIGGSMAIGSTQLVTNLNADLLDGLHASDLVGVGSTGSFIYTASNGLTKVGNDFQLGGTLTGNTSIGTSSFSLNIGQGATQSLFISSDGKIGIGTTNPASKLTVSGDSILLDNTFGLKIKDSTNTARTILRYTSANAVVLGDSTNAASMNLQTAGSLVFESGGAEKMRLSSAGNLGIGTTNPSKKLDVAGDINLTGTIFTTGTSGTSGQILSSTGTGLSWINPSSIGATYTVTNGLNMSGNVIGLGGSLTASTRLNIGNTEVMYLSTSGNIGLGTTNPDHKLTVTGTGTATNIELNSGGVDQDTYLIFANEDGGHTESQRIGINGYNATFDIWDAQGFPITFSNGNTERMRIAANGYIGIGTTNPSQKLDINGSLNIGGSLAIGSTQLVTNLNADLLDGLHASSFLSTGYTGFDKYSSWTANVGTSTTTIGSTATLTFAAGTGMQATMVGNTITFTNTGLGTTYAAGSGLTLNGSTFNLGGTLSQSVNLNVGSTSALFINGTNGNVGIGMTNPLYKFTVSGTQSNVSFIRTITLTDVGSTVVSAVGSTFSDADSGKILLWGDSTSRNIVGINVTSPAIAYIDSTANINATQSVGLYNPNFYIGADGRVGVNTTNNTAQLTVNGDIVASKFASLYDYSRYYLDPGNTSSTNSSLSLHGNGSITFNTETIGGVQKSIFATAATRLKSYANGFGIATNIGSTTAGGNITWSEALFVKNNGNVGIGTTDPSAKLEIAGSSSTITNTAGDITLDAASGSVSFSGDNLINFGRAIAGSGTSAAPAFTFGSDTSSGLYSLSSGIIGIATTGIERLRIDNTGNVTIGNSQAVTINSSGNLGLGTTNPSKKLDVAGDINLTGTIFAAGTSGTSGQILSSTGTGLSWINASSVGQTYSVTNGLNMSSNVIGLGGTLTQNTLINTSTNSLSFLGLGNTQSLFIGWSGFVGIGTTNPTKKFEVVGTSNFTGNVFVGGTAFTAMNSQMNGRVRMVDVGCAGSWASSCDAGQNGYADYADALVSDARLKNVIAPVGPVLEKLNKINALYYSWNDLYKETGQPLHNEQEIGVLAQNVQEQFPELVFHEGVNDPYWHMDYQKFTAVLLKGIQEIDTKIEGLSVADNGQISVNFNVSPEVLASLGYSDTKNEIETATYSVTDATGSAVTRLANFAQITTGKISSGLVSTTNLIAKNLLAETTKSKVVKTDLIAPLDEVTDTINVGGTLITEELRSDKLISNSASISGTLYADKVISKEGDFGQVMTDKITALRDELKNVIASTTLPEPATPSAIALESQGWTYDVATSQVTVTGDMSLTNNLVIGAKLSVIGDTQLGNAFITGTFTAGEIAIKDNFIETTNTALYIQPSGLGKVDIMNHTLVIAENGTVALNGNLGINGSVTASEATISGSLFANLINADEINTKKINVATDSATTNPIIAESGFAALATNSAAVDSNAAAGVATLPAGKTELVINNQKITSTSIIYLTPVGSTNNQVVYLKSKTVSPAPSPTETPESTASATPTPSNFVIAIDQPLSNDININWWIIN